MPLNRNVNRTGLNILNNKGILTGIEFITTKVVYNAFLVKRYVLPAGTRKWQELFSKCEEVKREAKCLVDITSQNKSRGKIAIFPV